MDGLTNGPHQSSGSPDKATRADRDGASLWRITHAFWALPGVEKTCLRWQAAFDFDVSIFCWASWAAGTTDIALHQTDVASAVAAVDEWRLSVIGPIRSARKYARPPDPNGATAPAREAYRALRAAELAAERAEQQMLVDWMINRLRRAERSIDIHQAMSTVVELSGAELNVVDRERLHVMAIQFAGLLCEHTGQNFLT
jgi:uncharacterized protein (TIGR02444 family)